jgi:hypothetical protein
LPIAISLPVREQKATAVMHEARDIEATPSPSTVTPVLVVAGVLIGLLLLLCGGATGYVALTYRPPPEVKRKASPEDSQNPMQERYDKMRQSFADDVPFTDDPAVVRKIAAAIVDIDLPAVFEPIEGLRYDVRRRAVFGKKTEDAAILKLGACNTATGRSPSPASLDDPMMMKYVLGIAETENGRTTTILKAAQSQKKGEYLQRDLTVLGQKAAFAFKHGKRTSDNKPVWKIWGSFTTANGAAALILLVPESEFDEEAIVRMIESIRPATDEKSGSSADTDKAANPE